MSESILQKCKECYFCGAKADLEEHHIFAGAANRKISETYGLKVWLCREHHTGKNGAQYCKEPNLRLKQDAESAFEKLYTRKLWMELIGKIYV